MNKLRIVLGSLIVVAGGLLATPGLRAAEKELKGTIAIDGSSTVFPISEAAADAFRKEQPSVRVTVGLSGTGGGFKKFASGATDISDASRPIKAEEDSAAQSKGVEYVELPIAFDGLTFVINKENTWCDSLTVDELKKMFVVSQSAGGATTSSKVMTWKDIRPEWPAEPIKFYIPGTDSGTFDYAKEVLANKDKGQAIREDVSASEDDNVLVQGVAGTKGAIGFFGLAYYEENADKLKVVAIDGGNGPVLPTTETVKDGSYSPFGRPLFIYVNAESTQRAEVDSFVRFYLTNAGEFAENVGYIPLTDELYERVRANYDAKKTGSQCSGVKGKLEAIYK